MTDLRFDDAHQVADWIETTVIARESALSVQQIEEAAKLDGALHAPQVAEALLLMAARGSTIGDAYPIDVLDSAVRPRTNARSTTYACLLNMSPGSPFRQLRARQPPDKMTVLFERIVVRAAERLFGDGAQAVRFGFPSDEGRPERFHDAVRWLAERMGVEPGPDYRPPLQKDGGVDVVVWRPFPDRRSGFPVALIQCTVGQDIVGKSRDVDLRAWAGWLVLNFDPTSMLAIPGTISRPRDWNRAAYNAVILDRMRLAHLLQNDDLGTFMHAERFQTSAFADLASELSGLNL